MSIIPSTLPVLEAAAACKERRAATVEEILCEKWGKDNIPYNESVDPEEPLVEELGIKRCRSFRADLLHKLRTIRRAHGGLDKEAAYAMKIPADRFSHWINLRQVPGTWAAFERIDSCYEYAIERLRLDATRRRAGPKRRGDTNLPNESKQPPP
jgi:hypothetical protein